MRLNLNKTHQVQQQQPVHCSALLPALLNPRRFREATAAVILPLHFGHKHMLTPANFAAASPKALMHASLAMQPNTKSVNCTGQQSLSAATSAHTTTLEARSVRESMNFCAQHNVVHAHLHIPDVECQEPPTMQMLCKEALRVGPNYMT